MKKVLFLGASAFLISAGVMAQSSEPGNRVKTKKETRIETRQQVRINDQVPAVDQVTTRKQAREQLRTKDPSGDPIMKQTRARDKIHQQDPAGGKAGKANRANAQGKAPVTVAGRNRGDINRAHNSQAMARGKTPGSAMQARPSVKMQGAGNGIRAHRPATNRGGRAGR